MHSESDDTGTLEKQQARKEERSSIRLRVLKSGVIDINQNFVEIPCVIRNLSETGALINITGEYVVPDNFNLRIAMDGFSVDCQVIRRDGHILGVKFVGEKQQMARKKVQHIAASSLITGQTPVDNRQPVEPAAQDANDSPSANPNRAMARKPGFGKRGL